MVLSLRIYVKAKLEIGLYDTFFETVNVDGTVNGNKYVLTLSRIPPTYPGTRRQGSLEPF